MIDRLIEDERGRDRLLAFISRRALPFRASVVDGRPRSTDQNRLMWQWAAEVAAHDNDQTAREVQLEWKLRFGVPMLMEEDPKFAMVWAGVERTHNYTERLALMDYFDVTSKLSVKTFAGFLDQIEKEYAHVELTIPEDRRHGPKIGSRVDRAGTGSGDTAAGEAQSGEETKGAVRGLYTSLQREAQAGDAPRTPAGSRRGE